MLNERVGRTWGAWLYRRDLFRGKAGGENDLKHFDVVAVTEFTVTDIRRLMDARTCLQANDTLTLVLKFDPTLEDVHKLKLRLVQVRLA